MAKKIVGRKKMLSKKIWVGNFVWLKKNCFWDKQNVGRKFCWAQKIGFEIIQSPQKIRSEIVFAKKKLGSFGSEFFFGQNIFFNHLRGSTGLKL